MSEGILSGLVVVEIAHPLTEYAGCVLAGLGAEVFLVEPPDGAATRQRRPYMPDAEASCRRSIPFLTRNANKYSVTVDPDRREDRALLTALVERADAVLDVADGVHDQLLESARSRVRITVTDERRLGASSIVPFAASGGLASSGWPDRPPCNAPGWLALDGASIYAACLALIGIIRCRRGARNVRYLVPLEEAAVAAMTPWTRPLCAYEMEATGQGVITRRMGDGGFPIYRASDGYVRVIIATPKQWQAFVTLLGSPEDLVEGPWADQTFRAENYDALQVYCQSLTADRSVAELFHEGQRLGLTISPVSRLSDFRCDPHIQSRRFFVSVQDPEFGDMELMRAPVLVGEDETDAAPVTTPVPAPALDAHRARAQALAAREVPALESGREAEPDRPLQGIRVLELGVGAVVPEAAAFMAAFGAEVLKIESRVQPDFLRRRGLRGFDDPDGCPTFNQLNLGVKSVAVDMTTPQGKALVAELAGHCDVVMENMRGGVVNKWGLHYERVRELRPDAIYLSSQGLGRGPYDGYQTFGPNLQTFSGVTWQWSHADDPFPVGTTLNHPDHMAGKQALVSLLGAILARLESGAGLFMEAAQVEAAAYLMSDRYLAQSLTEEELPPLGNRSRNFAPHGCYAAAGEDRWLALAIETDAQWRCLVDLVGAAPEGLNRDCVTEERLARAQDLDAWLSDWIQTQDVVGLELALRERGIPASRIVTGDDIVGDVALHESGFYAAIEHGEVGLRTYTGLPVLHGSGVRVPVTAPPALGEHTDSVLSAYTRVDAAELASLRAARIVGH